MIRKIENIAYEYEEGSPDLPALVFLPGFRSDMQGIKARYLQEKCRERGQPCLLLDYSGHGNSGGKFADGSIGQWTADALKVIDHIIRQDLIVVGSSMGGWIGLHVALQRPALVKAFAGIAAAPDFTRSIEQQVSPGQRNELLQQGYFSVPSGYGEDLTITAKLLEDGERQCLLDSEIMLKIPVVLVQGKQDTEVNWHTAEKIKAQLKKTAAEIIYIEDGDHRLSREQDLQSIDAAVWRLARDLHAFSG